MNLPFYAQLINLFAALLLLVAFAMLTQRRILSLIHLFAAAGLRAGAIDGDRRVLDESAASLLLRAAHAGAQGGAAAVDPAPAHRARSTCAGTWRPLINIPATMLIGIVLVIFAFNLAAPISEMAGTITKSTLGIATASILLSFLMMITRRKAVSQVIGFLAMENGLVLRRDLRDLRHADGRRARHRARRAGRHARLRRVLLPHPRDVRKPRHPSPGKAEGTTDMEAPRPCSAFRFAGGIVLALLGPPRGSRRS